MIVVNPEKCPESHKCPIVKLCPRKAVFQDGIRAPLVDSMKCSECLLCVNKCPYDAFENE